MNDSPSPDRVYYVVELGGSVKVKSEEISKASERAIVLQETITLCPSNRAKKVLIKGIDLIAYTEQEALDHYLNQKRQQIVDLQFTMVQAQQCIEAASEMLKHHMIDRQAASPSVVKSQI